MLSFLCGFFFFILYWGFWWLNWRSLLINVTLHLKICALFSKIFWFWFLTQFHSDKRLSMITIPLLPLSRFSRVQLCVTPQTAAHQAPPSLGFSRQEHWSRLPFPSPMHESEKWKWSRSVVSNSQRLHGLQPARLLHPWDLPGKSTGVGCHCL